MKAPVIVAFVVACLAACSGKSSNDSSAAASQTQATSADSVSPARENQGTGRLASIDPCALLTDDEIGNAADNSFPPSQREGLHNMGAKYQVTKEVDRSGMGPVCHVSWKAVAPGNDERAKGMFDIMAMTASHLKALEGMSRPHTGKRSAPISGIGNEAFYLEYAPSARVGDLGVSITEFSSADGGIDLLKEAAARLH